jgi:hypothetical protein
VFGLWHTSSPIGNIVGSGISTAVLLTRNWEAVLLSSAVLMLAAVVAFYITIVDNTDRT